MESDLISERLMAGDGGGHWPNPSLSKQDRDNTENRQTDINTGINKSQENKLEKKQLNI